MSGPFDATQTNVPSWFGGSVIAPLIVLAVAGCVAFYVKTRNQLAVLRDRSDHDDPEDGDLVTELRRNSRNQEDRIDDLERDLRRERESRQEDNRRNSEQIAELRETVAQLRTELTHARNQMQGRTETP